MQQLTLAERSSYALLQKCYKECQSYAGRHTIPRQEHLLMPKLAYLCQAQHDSLVTGMAFMTVCDLPYGA